MNLHKYKQNKYNRIAKSLNSEIIKELEGLFLTEEQKAQKLRQNRKDQKLRIQRQKANTRFHNKVEKITKKHVKQVRRRK